jgi:hypothetical protein
MASTQTTSGKSSAGTGGNGGKGGAAVKKHDPADQVTDPTTGTGGSSATGGDFSDFAEAPPDGGAEMGAAIEGIWDHERLNAKGGRIPFYGKLLEARVFEGNFGPSVLWVFRALARIPVNQDDMNGENASLPKGAIVGIFGSGGLRALKNMGGCDVWLQYLGEKQTKRGAMKHFKVIQKGLSTRVNVADNRPKAEESDENGGNVDDLPF